MPLPELPLRPPDLPPEAWEAMGFKPRQERPRPRTLYDNLPLDGLNDAGAINPKPPLRVPDPVVLVRERPADETTPFVPFHRVGWAELSAMGWIVERLLERFAGTHPQLWYSRLRTYLNDSAYFFVKTERACVLATTYRDPFGAFYVSPVFVLHQDLGPAGGSIIGSQGEREALQLLREAISWAKRLGAVEMRDIGAFCDVQASRLRGLRIERRDELYLVIE